MSGPMSDSKTKRHSLLVAVDFGTTYTGVAYSHSSAESIENIEPITNWGARFTQVKIPTEIKYKKSGGDPLWGLEATSATASSKADNDEVVYGRFKLLLDPTVGRDVYGELGSQADTISNIPLPEGKSAVDVCADFLTQLYKHVMTVLETRIPDTIDQTPIEWIFTVPAIWSHRAQTATRTAAEIAGFGKGGREFDSLRFISEPEAAAMFAITAMHEEKKALKKNGVESQQHMAVKDHFIVCDAGGGTVDLITYQIEEDFPDLVLKESVVGSGGKCGSTFIDEGFYRMLRDRIGPNFDKDEIWLPRYKGRGSELTQQFETCKRSFGTQKLGATGKKWFIQLPLEVPDDATNRIIDSELELNEEDMKSLFDPVVDDVVKLVNAQALKVRKLCQETKGNLSTVILVGGFGESRYLYGQLSAWAKDQSPPLTVVNPAKSWSAIMRGAVAQALNPAVRSRKLRCHYGFGCATEYNKEIHKRSEAWLCAWGGLQVSDNVRWTGAMGDDCSTDRLVEFPVFWTFTESEPKTASIDLFGCHYMETPHRHSSDKVFDMGKLTVDFSEVKLSGLQSKKKSGVKTYKINGVVKMLIGSADVTFTIWVGSKSYGQSKISYD